MGLIVSRIQDKVILKKVSKRCGLEKHDLQQIMKTMRLVCKGKYVTNEQLRASFKIEDDKISDGMVDSLVRMFTTLEGHIRRKKLSREMYVSGMLVFTYGTPIQRFKVCFKMFDTDNSKTLDEDEVHAIVEALLGHKSKSKDRKRLTKKLFQMMDRDRDNLITVEEFTRVALSYQPLNSALLGMCLPIYSRVNPYTRRVLFGEQDLADDHFSSFRDLNAKRKLIRASSSQYLSAENTSLMKTPTTPTSKEIHTLSNQKRKESKAARASGSRMDILDASEAQREVVVDAFSPDARKQLASPKPDTHEPDFLEVSQERSPVPRHKNLTPEQRSGERTGGRSGRKVRPSPSRHQGPKIKDYSNIDYNTSMKKRKSPEPDSKKRTTKTSRKSRIKTAKGIAEDDIPEEQYVL
mmetsp:Transcript_9741/g.36253  ORF Transcript_9741/g.36253 Transcript_9741/m.36253 type:complete len:408 (-) Transcript_9741:6-1229(-)